MKQPQQQLDIFLYRLLAAIACGMAVILTAYSTYLYLLRIPAMVDMFLDFDMNLPTATRMVVSAPWLALLVSTAGACLGIVAVLVVKRAVLALCWVFVLTSVAIVIATDLALHSPMYSLAHSVQG